MTTEIITRALLEHYLRAMGAPPRKGEDWSDALRAIIAIAAWEDVPIADLSARLGLCAAAEYHARQKFYAEDIIARPTDTIDALNAHQIALIERDNHKRHMRAMLLMAGVDPQRWEDARREQASPNGDSQ